MTVDSVETLVIHPGALGDVLQAVPALAALGRLGNRLTFAGQPRLGELLKGSGVVLAAAPFDTFGLEALFVDAPVSDRLASRLERFRRVGAETIEYRVTVDDPRTFMRSWTAEIPMTSRDAPHGILEFACHEGNYAVPHILSGARTRSIDKN